MSGSFTLVGRLLHHDKVTPLQDEPIVLTAGTYPVPGDHVTYAGGADEITDADGNFAFSSLLSEPDLYYVATSPSIPPAFEPVVFLAGADGSTLHFDALDTYDPTGILPSLYTDIIAARNAAVAAAASVATSTWQATTAVVAGQAKQAPDGSTIIANSSRTTRATFDATEKTFWTAVSVVPTSFERTALDAYSATVNARSNGAKGDGTTDDTTALAAALTACAAYSAGGTVFVPDGTYKVTAALTIPVNVTLVLAPGATLKAGGTIAGAMVKTPLSTLVVSRMVMRGGHIDCNALADTGLSLAYFNHAEVRDVTVHSPKVKGFQLGSTSAPAKSYEAMLYNCHTYRPSTLTAPASSRAMSFDNCSDSHVYGSILNGCDVGLYTDFGGHTFVGVHVWNFQASGDPTTCFYDNGGNNAYVNCYADNFVTAGFQFMADGCTLTSPFLIHGRGTDNTGSAFVNGQAFAVVVNVVGGRIDCDPAHRLAVDWSGITSAVVQRDLSQHNVVKANIITSQVIPAEVSVANTTVETALITYPIRANRVQVGTTFRVTVGGLINNVAASGTLTIQLKWGTFQLVGFAIPSQAGAATNQQWFAEFLVTVRSLGASGTAVGSGQLNSAFSSQIKALGGVFTTVDTTTDQNLTFTVQWATANAANICKAEVLAVEVVKA